jgi:predicted aspartyl protease
MGYGIAFLSRAVLLIALSGASLLDAQDLVKPAASPMMPFELVSGFLVVVNGRIGNLDDLKFILDTGASKSVIDRKVADRLGLPRRAGAVLNFERRIPVGWTDIPELQVGPLRAEGVRLMVVDLAKYFEFGKHADGIIGLDLLSRSNKFTIDYRRRVVSLQLPEERHADRAASACFLVPLVIQGQQIQVVVDTGLQGIVLYKNGLHKQLPKLRMEGGATNVTMGPIRASQIRLRDVQISGAEAVVTVLLIDDPDGGALPGVDGYLGPASLAAERVEFDFVRSVLRWQ